jgi:L-ribulose-5-phosphate 3-epimerase
MPIPRYVSSRRHFLGSATAALAGVAATGVPAAATAQPATSDIVRPPEGKRILLACKLGMIAKEQGGTPLSLVQRLRMAAEAGFDGVDFDEAGSFTAEDARAAVRETRVFVHGAINHDHWNQRLTSAVQAERDQGRANLEHCVRLSHATGGSGVLLVVGRNTDGPEAEIEGRARQEIRKVLPLAAALGQMILIENVGNRMMYDADGEPDQGPQGFIRFVDSFRSPWVGMYYDIGNHWRYGQPGEWIRSFGYRCVKLDIKGRSRALGKGVEIASTEDDVPWDHVRRALADIGWSGWATAEVRGGDLARLTLVRQQMQQVLGIGPAA